MSCDACRSLGPGVTITTKEFDAGRNLIGTIDGKPPETFPAAALLLERVSTSMRRCSGCGSDFRWSESESSIQGGPESYVYESLQRVEPAAALELIAREAEKKKP